MSKNCEQKFWTKVLNKNSDQKFWTRVVYMSGFMKVELSSKAENKSWLVNKSCEQEFSCGQNLWTNVFKCYQYVWCCPICLGTMLPVRWVGGERVVVGWLVGWWEPLKIRLNSAQLQLELFLSLAKLLVLKNLPAYPELFWIRNVILVVEI